MNSAEIFELYSEEKKKSVLQVSDLLLSRSFWIWRKNTSIIIKYSFKGEILTVTIQNYLSVHDFVRYFIFRSQIKKDKEMQLHKILLGAGILRIRFYSILHKPEVTA